MSFCRLKPCVCTAMRAGRRIFVRRNRKRQHKGANTMYKITEKVALNPTVTKMVIEAPLIAKKAKPGQFIIVRPFEDSERIPLTVAGYDREKGTVDIIFQIVGGTTMELLQCHIYAV